MALQATPLPAGLTFKHEQARKFFDQGRVYFLATQQGQSARPLALKSALKADGPFSRPGAASPDDVVYILGPDWNIGGRRADVERALAAYYTTAPINARTGRQYTWQEAMVEGVRDATGRILVRPADPPIVVDKNTYSQANIGPRVQAELDRAIKASKDYKAKDREAGALLLAQAPIAAQMWTTFANRVEWVAPGAPVPSNLVVIQTMAPAAKTPGTRRRTGERASVVQAVQQLQAKNQIGTHLVDISELHLNKLKPVPRAKGRPRNYYLDAYNLSITTSPRGDKTVDQLANNLVTALIELGVPQQNALTMGQEYKNRLTSGTGGAFAAGAAFAPAAPFAPAASSFAPAPFAPSGFVQEPEPFGVGIQQEYPAFAETVTTPRISAPAFAPPPVPGGSPRASQPRVFGGSAPLPPVSQIPGGSPRLSGGSPRGGSPRLSGAGVPAFAGEQYPPMGGSSGTLNAGF